MSPSISTRFGGRQTLQNNAQEKARQHPSHRIHAKQRMGARDAETLDFVSRDRLDGKSAYGRACSRRMHAQTHVIRAIASQRKGTPETTTRVCVVPGLRFAGGGTPKTKTRA